MTAAVIGVDPGTSKMGVAIWQPAADYHGEPELRACFPLVTPTGGRYRIVAWRIVWMLWRLGRELESHGISESGNGSGTTLVMEHLTGHAIDPAPQLDTMIASLHQWARGRGWRHVEYPPNVWRAVVRMKGVRDSKEVVRWAMEAKVPALRGLAGVTGGMDAIEAAGIGLYHCDLLRLEQGAQSHAEGQQAGRRRA